MSTTVDTAADRRSFYIEVADERPLIFHAVQ
jgi:hypothetical protein